MDSYKMGWLPDFPDLRDYTQEHELIKEMIRKVGITKVNSSYQLPASVDLSKWCSPIENQGNLGSCTAQAGVGLVEYYENRAFGKYENASRLFLYKTTRDLLNLTGDTGAYIRTTLGALALFGVPPEKYWPYDISKFDNEPLAFCYSFGQNYKTINYFKLDTLGLSSEDLLTRIKTYLLNGIPSMFGFTVYSSYTQANKTGKIPYPSSKETVVGGHAVVAVGYDDTLKITNTISNKTTTGALLIRNSWGMSWGASGYGWLPYDYVLNKIAIDFWSILSNSWVDTSNFFYS